jgi:3',5'-cyclic AMP phosphodiesterase CpdA
MSFVKPGPRNGAFTLVHFSDLHLCRPAGASPAGFLNKRLFSWLSWRVRRRRVLPPEVWPALARAVKGCAADLVAVTGDLTHLGLPAEFELAARFLEQLAPPGRVMVVPGNHDALRAAEWARGLSTWADFLRSGDPEGTVGFPALRVHGRVAVIGLSTACPSPPLLAIGRLGADQLEALDALLKRAAERGLFRLVLIHHPPVARMVSPHKRLIDAAALRAVLAARGAELILHGHAHRRTVASVPGPGGPIPVLGISAAACAGTRPERRAAFRVLRIEEAGAGLRAAYRDQVFVPGEGRFEPEGGPEAAWIKTRARADARPSPE